MTLYLYAAVNTHVAACGSLAQVSHVDHRSLLDSQVMLGFWPLANPRVLEVPRRFRLRSFFNFTTARTQLRTYTAFASLH